MLRCAEVTRLYASDDIGRSSLRLRLAARLHLVMCDLCRRYVRELGAIGKAARAMAREDTPDPDRIEAIIRRLSSTP